MPLPNLIKASSFRLTLIYTAVFCASVVALLGFIYWSTVAVIEQQSIETIEAEIRGLAEQYGRCRTTETYRGDVAAALLEMTPAVRRADDARRAELAAAAASEAGLATEVDFIFTTHRVWLGTGGYAERDDPDALY